MSDVDVISPEEWLLSALPDMVTAHCATLDDKLDSFRGWPANATAMRLLAEVGLIEITSDQDERLLAEVLPAASSLTARVEAARRIAVRRAGRTSWTILWE